MGAKSTGVSAFTNMGLLKPLIYKQRSKAASDSDTEYFIIFHTQKTGWPRHTENRGKQGIWFFLFPDRENTGNFVLTQGKIC